LLIVLLIITNIVTISFSHSIYKDYKSDDHITYVKLDPHGNWTIERSNLKSSDFYLTTVNASLYRLLSKCFSSVRATLINDWSVCRVFLSDDLDKSFVSKNYLVGNQVNDIYEYISKLSKCSTCTEIKAIVKDHDHKNYIPTSFRDGRNEGVYFESIFYMDLENIKSGSITKTVVSLTWAFLPEEELNQLDEKYQLQSINDALIESPLGIYFVDWTIIEDKNNE
jgi:hypothetical protein